MNERLNEIPHIFGIGFVSLRSILIQRGKLEMLTTQSVNIPLSYPA
jgi:hypothetical protein